MPELYALLDFPFSELYVVLLFICLSNLSFKLLIQMPPSGMARWCSTHLSITNSKRHHPDSDASESSVHENIIMSMLAPVRKMEMLSRDFYEKMREPDRQQSQMPSSGMAWASKYFRCRSGGVLSWRHVYLNRYVKGPRKHLVCVKKVFKASSPPT